MTNPAVLALLVSLSPAAFAQSPAFDAASIKLHKSGPAPEGANRESIEAQPGSLTMRNVNLLSCVRWAYGLREYEVSGPAALTDEKYDILARADSRVPLAHVAEMLQVLLAERFQLRAHREKKERPVYVLALAKSGPKVQQADPGGNTAMFRRDGSFVFRSRSMQQFADDLSGLARVDRPVLDHTGIPGVFDFSLKFGDTGEEMKRVLNDGDGASLFTLIQEQLGFNVEAKKAMIDMLVVDHVEKAPAEN
jgi:uncharacterized protein (TIGR03435 family)